MRTDSLEPGYYVATDERVVTRYNTQEECEHHIKFQRENMGSTITWYIIHIPKVEWIKTDKYKP